MRNIYFLSFLLFSLSSFSLSFILRFTLSFLHHSHLIFQYSLKNATLLSLFSVTLFSSPTHFLYFLTINFSMYLCTLNITFLYVFCYLFPFIIFFLLRQLSQLHIILFFLLFIQSHRFCLSIKMNFGYISHMFLLLYSSLLFLFYLFFSLFLIIFRIFLSLSTNAKYILTLSLSHSFSFFSLTSFSASNNLIDNDCVFRRQNTMAPWVWLESKWNNRKCRKRFNLNEPKRLQK